MEDTVASVIHDDEIKRATEAQAENSVDELGVAQIHKTFMVKYRAADENMEDTNKHTGRT